MYRRQMYTTVLCFALSLILIGLLWEGLPAVLAGLGRLIVHPSVLTTDYISVAGPGATLVNSGLVTLMSLALLFFSESPATGLTLAGLSLMAGFSMFGKNIYNILPIFLGGWLYAKWKGEPFSRHSLVTLMSTALAPLVSYGMTDGGPKEYAVSIGLGLLIGFVMPPLAQYTSQLRSGMNLYHMGFTCGMLGMVLVPLLRSCGREMKTVLRWAQGYNHPLGMLVCLLCVGLILVGFFFAGRPPRDVGKGYRRLLRTTGRAPSDYLEQFGGGVVLVNMGVNGLASVGYLLAIDGDLNGATLAAIFSVMGFSAFGKHLRNILPIMAGVVLGGLTMRWELNDPTLQIAGLFGTTLAPIAGCYGWPYGILAGFLHSSVVRNTSAALAGLNLYNNGFSGGLLALVLHPIFSVLTGRRKSGGREEEP